MTVIAIVLITLCVLSAQYSRLEYQKCPRGRRTAMTRADAPRGKYQGNL